MSGSSLNLKQVIGGAVIKQGDTNTRLGYELLDKNSGPMYSNIMSEGDNVSVTVVLTEVRKKTSIVISDATIRNGTVIFNMPAETTPGRYDVEMAISVKGQTAVFPSTYASVTLEITKSYLMGDPDDSEVKYVNIRDISNKVDKSDLETKLSTKADTTALEPINESVTKLEEDISNKVNNADLEKVKADFDVAMGSLTSKKDFEDFKTNFETEKEKLASKDEVVLKEVGKGLSDNNFDNQYKQKLDDLDQTFKDVNDKKADKAELTVLSESSKIIDTKVKETKNQISDLQAFVGYTDDDIMGVEVDFKNKKFTRLAGAVNRTPGAMFDDVQAFGGRKRCILTDDGVVLAYHGEPGYTETGALTQEIVIELEPAEGENPAVTETYPVGEKVQVMVEQPKFYYKVVPLQLDKVVDGKGFHMRKARYYVSDVKKTGFKLHPAFIKDGKEKNFIYLSAYEGSVYDKSASAYLLADEQIVDFAVDTGDLLSSIAYAKPTSGVTQTGASRIGFRRIAANRGEGWSQPYAATVAATQLLFTIEYASMNTQTSIGRGNVDTAYGELTISYTEITGATTNLGNESGSVQNTNGINIVTYRGEENWWGNIWKWVDGLNIFNQSDLYVADHDFADDIGTDPYEDAGITLSKVVGYISAFGYNEKFDWLFFPSETSGDSALPVGDNFYHTTALDAWRAARLGGSWYNGSSAGGFYWSVHDASSYRYRTIGGRLVYVPAKHL